MITKYKTSRPVPAGSHLVKFSAHTLSGSTYMLIAVFLDNNIVYMRLGSCDQVWKEFAYNIETRREGIIKLQIMVDQPLVIDDKFIGDWDGTNYLEPSK